MSAPVAPAQRLPWPDLLRGLAILGILAVNMQDFAGYDEWRQPGADRLAQQLIDIFFNGKFISLLAVLFGAGMQAMLGRPSVLKGAVLAKKRPSVLKGAVLAKKRPSVLKGAVLAKKRPSVLKGAVLAKKRPSVLKGAVLAKKRPSVLKGAVLAKKRPSVVNGTSSWTDALEDATPPVLAETRAGTLTLLRRLLALLLLGSLHAVLLWRGDILSLYALSGLALLPFLLLRPRPWVLLVAAGGLGGGWLLARCRDALHADTGTRWSFGLHFAPGEGYAQLVAGRAGTLIPDLLADWAYNAPWLMALLLLGVAAQRAGLLARPGAFRPLLGGLAWAGVLLGLPLSALLAWLNTVNSAEAGLWAVPVRLASGLLLGLAYAAGTGLLLARGQPAGRWLATLAAPGRLALSLYLGQSLAMTTLFYPYGLNLYRQLGALPCALLAAGLGLVQWALAGWWLRRGGGPGPAERLLRWLVYGRGRR